MLAGRQTGGTKTLSVAKGGGAFSRLFSEVVVSLSFLFSPPFSVSVGCLCGLGDSSVLSSGERKAAVSASRFPGAFGKGNAPPILHFALFCNAWQRAFLICSFPSTNGCKIVSSIHMKTLDFCVQVCYALPRLFLPDLFFLVKTSPEVFYSTSTSPLPHAVKVSLPQITLWSLRVLLLDEDALFSLSLE